MAEFNRGRESGRAGGNRRDERARAAAARTEDMERRFGKEIEASAAGVRRIDGMPKAVNEPITLEGSESTEPGDKALPAVSVVDQDTVAAILERGRGRAQFTDLAVLDFASFTNPGGGYERGSMAQEEALCTESFLYNVLSRNKDWYAENRRRNLNCNLYRDRALVVPAVRFAREKTHAYADVIVAAAPNASRARSEYNVKSDVLERAMRTRIRFALAIADQLGHDKLILGAYGCGVFGWEPETVAELFREELATGDHVAREVIFAIPRVRYNENHEVFAHVLGTFPDRNAVSYEDAKAARVAQQAADAEAAEAEAEDDWRQYL